jgi:DNA-binding transcriptional LysR family regulator
MAMELRYIRYFLAVAEERHFTRAAAKVGIGQPPLSQQIKDLEGEVGAALFHRLAHGAELTEAGKAFLAGVKEMPLIAERATMAARHAARRDRCVSASPHRLRSTSWYRPTIRAFRLFGRMLGFTGVGQFKASK